MKKVATCRARPWIEDTDNEDTELEKDEDEHEIVEVDNHSTRTESTEHTTEDLQSLNSLDEDDGRESSCRMVELSFGEENVEKRLKRGSFAILLKAAENLKQCGRVKYVGKAGSKKKNTCWVEVDGKIEELDFMKDVTGCKKWRLKESSFKTEFNKQSKCLQLLFQPANTKIHKFRRP
jgi:hypothetical protein